MEQHNINGIWVTEDGGYLVLNEDNTFESYNIDLCDGKYDEYFESNSGTWTVKSETGEILFDDKSPETYYKIYFRDGETLAVGMYKFTKTDTLENVNNQAYLENEDDDLSDENSQTEEQSKSTANIE